jgi:hypothetical protein
MPDTIDRLEGARTTFGMKKPVVAATTGVITLSGEQTIDGIAVVENDRVLVKDQASASFNGIYYASTGDWTRAVDFDGATDFTKGTCVPVAAGSANAGRIYRVTSSTPAEIDVDAIDFDVVSFVNPNDSSALNVQDYGAVGDGVTDDSAAFQAAIDAASGVDGLFRVYVPNTVLGYAIGATLEVPTGVVVFGDNRKGLQLSRIKPTAGFSSPLFQTEDYGVTRKLRIGIEGLYLDGSSTTLTAIRVNCQESHFRDLTIKNCFTYGIHIAGVGSGASEQALNNHIEDCLFAGISGVVEFFDAVFVDYNSADNTIRDNYIEACKDAGVRSRGYNDKILNNHIYSISATGGGAGCGIYSETSADKDISHNYIELTAAGAILIDGGASDFGTLAAVVSGNVLRNINTGAGASGAIVVQGSFISSISVIGNVVRRDNATSYSTLYFVFFSSITPARVRVQGNQWQASVVTTAETNVGGRYFNVTPTSNSATSENDLMSFVLPADLLELSGSYLKMTAWGITSTLSTAVTKRMRMYFGATAVADTGALLLAGGTWKLDALVARTTTAGTQAAIGVAAFSTGAAGVAGSSQATLITAPGEALLGVVTAKITALATASTGQVTANGFLIEPFPR